MSAAVESTWKTKISDSVEIPILTRCCLCVPLRKGLIAFGYINLILSVLMTCLLSYYIGYIRHNNTPHLETSDYARLIIDIVALCIETGMTITFLVGLHKKHVLIMKIYLYYEMIFTVIAFIDSIVFMSKESSSEVFLILFQLLFQAYLSVLIWSSIVKMERDGTVKYTREHNEV